VVGRLAVLASIILISGCATNLTPEEEILRVENAEWKREIDLANYLTCEHNGGVFVHYNHHHDTSRFHRQRPVHYSDIRRDLWDNNCRSFLGSAWIPY